MTGRALRRRFLKTALGALGVFFVCTGPLVAPGTAQDLERRGGFSIEITTPENQEFVLGKTRIAAEVRIPDECDLDRVEFSVGDDVVFVDREAPFECFYTFEDETKPSIVRAVAYHREGLTVSDVVITRKLSFSSVERVNRVLLWVTVTDPRDEFVTELSPEDFRLDEDGKPQQILELVHEDRPITIAILLDTSLSMEEEMDTVHDAAGSFVEALRPEDRALVIDFDDRVFLIQDLTTDRDALVESITSTTAFGGTALYDALHAAYRKMRGIDGRKAIVLLSDGEDSASQFGYDRVLQETRANDVAVYSIALGDGDRRVLKRFADVSGGRFHHAKRPEQLAAIYARIAEELRHQMYLTYSTSIEEWDGRWIEVEVESTLPGHDVRARRGFFAVRSSP